MMKKPTIAQAVEKKIKQEYFFSGEDFLPSAVEIAAKFGVSRNNVLKALQSLATQGLVEIHPGRRTKISGNRTLLSNAAMALKAQIENGKLSVASRLPKLAYLSNELDCSPRAIQSGLVELESLGWVHKRGRGWYVGKKPLLPNSNSLPKPTIIVILNNPTTWLSLTKDRTARFIRTFQDQINRLGIEMRPVYPPDRAFNADELRFSTPEFDQLVKQLGSRLIGILIPLNNRPHLTSFVLESLSTKAPLIFWADFHDEKLNWAKDKFPNLIKGRFSEIPALELAKELFLTNGHKKIVYPYDPAISWQNRRLEKFKSIMDGEMELIPVELKPDQIFQKFHLLAPMLQKSKHLFPSPTSEILTGFFSGNTRFYPDKIDPKNFYSIDQLLSVSLPDYRKEKVSGILRTLAFTPVFAPVLQHAEMTAICLPNEDYARSFYKWCAMIGLSIPEELSILSFDNYFQHSLVPISSIDFGLDWLAYSAVHLMFGDIPIKTGRDKCILSRPFLSERGSLGPARKKKLQNKFLKYLSEGK